MTPKIRSLFLAAVLAVGTLVSPGAAAVAGTGQTADRSAKPLTIAVLGDVPYGPVQESTVGGLVAAVNDDPKVRVVMHVGDFKSGSTTCSDERFAAARATFDSFKDALVYTPGPPCQAVARHPGAPGPTVEGGEQETVS